MSYLTKNNEWDMYEGEEPEHGFDISDHELLDLIEHVETSFTGLHLLQESYTPADRLAVEVTSAFWDDELWIVVYDHDRAMGGPEEGGWSYPVFSKISQHKVEADSWAERIKQVRTALEQYRGYYDSISHGTPGSYAPDRQNYMVQVEIVPQDWERNDMNAKTMNDLQGPGKAERVGRPRYS